jgi:hypothetical protein
MLDNCITKINVFSNPLHIDRCENTINYEVINNLDAYTLAKMSNHCFNLYKNRLGKISEPTYEIGSLEYDSIHRTLIRALVSYKPKNLSFSISSSNPSLHFIIRLPKNISIFVETYINPEEDNNTYLQILDDDEALLQADGSYNECLSQMEEKLTLLFPSIQKTYVEL